MSLDAHKKPILEQTPEEFINTPQSHFSENVFNDAVFDKGYDILIEKALRCPCTDSKSGQALSDCLNCGGRGWLFINKKRTNGVVQSINRKTKYQNWTEDDKGTASLTVRAVDRIAFMDRVTLLSVSSIYSENLKFRKFRDKLYSYTIYNPLIVTEAYLFQGVDKQLKPLKLGVDYTVDENKIVLSNSYGNLNIENVSVTVRYTHYPQYNVIDIPREVIVNKQKDCAEESINANLPIHAVIRKTHYVLDAPNLYGDSLFDNTDYSSSTITNILDSLDPTSLFFYIVRSTASQIQQALMEEGNTAKITELKSLLP